MSDGGEPLQAVLARAIAESVAARESEIRAEAAAAGEAGIAPPDPPTAIRALSGYLRDWITQRCLGAGLGDAMAGR